MTIDDPRLRLTAEEYALWERAYFAALRLAVDRNPTETVDFAMRVADDTLFEARWRNPAFERR